MRWAGWNPINIIGQYLPRYYAQNSRLADINPINFIDERASDPASTYGGTDNIIEVSHRN